MIPDIIAIAVIIVLGLFLLRARRNDRREEQELHEKIGKNTSDR